MSKQQQEHAIVVGIDTLQGLQTARILAGHNIPVIGVASNLRHHACRTNVCEKILQADTTGDNLVETLTSLGPTLPGKAVLYPCHDQCVWLISRHRDALKDWYHIMLADHKVINTLAAKNTFYELANELEIAVPQTYILRNRADAINSAEQLRYPCILKPVRRGPRWNEHTMSKAFRADNAETFLALYDRVCLWAPELVAQQWIVGTDADLYSCNCYYDQHSNLVTTFIARKLRQWPPHTGSSCLGEECRNDVVLQAAIRIFSSIGYAGLGYIEMKRDRRTNEFYVIEANVGRPTGRSAIAEAGGVDMLLAMYCDAVGLSMPPNLQQKYLGAKWIDLRHDIQSAVYYFRQGELTLADWYESWRGRKAHAILSLRDPLPFWADLWRVLMLAFSPKERAMRKHTPIGKTVRPAAVRSSNSIEPDS